MGNVPFLVYNLGIPRFLRSFVGWGVASTKDATVQHLHPLQQNSSYFHSAYHQVVVVGYGKKEICGRRGREKKQIFEQILHTSILHTTKWWLGMECRRFVEKKKRKKKRHIFFLGGGGNECWACVSPARPSWPCSPARPPAWPRPPSRPSSGSRSRSPRSCVKKCEQHKKSVRKLSFFLKKKGSSIVRNGSFF